jgi:hypothetical protein
MSSPPSPSTWRVVIEAREGNQEKKFGVIPNKWFTSPSAVSAS